MPNEDTLRYVKTSYNVEHVRVLDYQRLKNMAALIADGLKWLFVSHGKWRGPSERFDGRGDLQMELEFADG